MVYIFLVTFGQPRVTMNKCFICNAIGRKVRVVNGIKYILCEKHSLKNIEVWI